MSPQTPETLSLTDTLWPRLTAAALVPALGWAILYVPVAGLSLGAALVGLLAIPLLSMAIMLGWPIARRLNAEEDHLSVRWWSYGDSGQEFPLETVASIWLTGDTLRIASRDRGIFRIRVPNVDRARVSAWVTAVERRRRALQDSVVSRDIPASFARYVVARTHEGVRLRFDAVYAPLPPLIEVMLGGMVCLSTAFVWLAFWPGAHVLALVLALVAEVVVCAWLFAKQIKAMEVEVMGSRLEIVLVRTRSSQRWTVPLVDLRGVEQRWGHLWLALADQTLKIPMPARSEGTLDLLRALLAQQAERAAPLRGEIAPEIEVLLRGAQASEQPRRTTPQ